MIFKSDNLIKSHVLISGRVQGVFFRYYTVQTANKYGLSGWVKNTKDKKVEVVLVGEKPAIQKIIRWFWQGPPLSRVIDVTILSEKKVTKDEFNGLFSQKRSY